MAEQMAGGITKISAIFSNNLRHHTNSSRPWLQARVAVSRASGWRQILPDTSKRQRWGNSP
jgi:hypothetical protein